MPYPERPQTIALKGLPILAMGNAHRGHRPSFIQSNPITCPEGAIQGYFLRLQTDYDLRLAKRELAPRIEAEVTPL